jgi:hypothetical protein
MRWCGALSPITNSTDSQRKESGFVSLSSHVMSRLHAYIVPLGCMHAQLINMLTRTDEGEVWSFLV